MKTIGMIGGMAWESTAVYYELINREIQKRLGGLHSAKIVMHSFDFEDIAALQRTGRWEEAAKLLASAGVSLARAGADFLVICTNTMHRSAAAVEKAAGVPLLHIADPLGEAIRAAGFMRVGLLGTKFTMESRDILHARLERHYDLELMTPQGKDAAEVHRIIYDELVRGEVIESSRAAYRRIMAQLAADGAQAVILGCTEIMLLVRPQDCSVPLFDTTTLHAQAAAARALEDA